MPNWRTPLNADPLGGSAVPSAYVSRAHQWKQRGRVYLWRYLENERNYPGWHMSLDPVAIENLGELFRILNEDETRCHRTFRLSPPTPEILRVANNYGGKAKYKAPTKLRLYFDPAAEVGWALSDAGDPLEWQLGRSGLSEVVAFFDEPHRYFDEQFGGDPSIWWWGLASSAA